MLHRRVSSRWFRLALKACWPHKRLGCREPTHDAWKRRMMLADCLNYSHLDSPSSSISEEIVVPFVFWIHSLNHHFGLLNPNKSRVPWGNHTKSCGKSIVCLGIPSGKLTVCYGKSPFLMGKSTISMVIFNGWVYPVVNGGSDKRSVWGTNIPYALYISYWMGSHGAT